LVGVVTLDDICDGGFDQGDIRCRGGFGAEFGDEAAVVEGPALGRLGGVRSHEVIWVGDVHGFGVVGDLVAVAGDGIDVVEAVYKRVSDTLCSTARIRTPHAQLLQRIDAAGL